MVISICEGNVGTRPHPTEAVVFLPFSLPQVQTKVYFRTVLLSLKERPLWPGCEMDFVVVTVNVLYNGNMTGDPIEKLPAVQT